MQNSTFRKQHTSDREPVTRPLARKTPDKGNASTSSLHHSVSCDVRHEIEKLIHQTDELIEILPAHDTDYEQQIKKLKEIRKFLTKKTSPSRPNILQRFLQKPKERHFKPEDDEYCEQEPSDFHDLESERVVRQDLVNMNLDDSILHVADDLITIFNFCKSLVNSK